MTGPVRLTAIVIGPEARGRNYGIRRRAGASPGSEALARLGDFALAFTGWALRRRDAMSAVFPLDAAQTQFAIVKGRWLSDGEQGPVAVAHVLIAPASLMAEIDWAADRLLAAIAEPGVAPFAETEVVIDPATLGAGWRTAGGPNAAWSDLVVEMQDADPAAALSLILASVQPVAQRARLTGWATTTSLESAGNFEPTALFRVAGYGVGEAPGRFAETHQLVRLDPDALRGAEAPEIWSVFSRLRALAGREPAAATLTRTVWQPGLVDEGPAALASAMILRACLDLGPLDQVRLVRAVALDAIDESRGVEAIRSALGDAFAAMIAHRDDEATAFYVQNLLQDAPPGLVATVPGLLERAAAPGVFAWLGEEAAALDPRAVGACWLELIDGAGWVESLARGPRMLVARVLAACLAREPEDGVAWDRLAAGLLRLHARTGRSGPPAALAALKALVARGPSIERPDLIDPVLMRLAWAGAPAVAQDMVWRIAAPALAASETEEGVLWAVEACLDAGERAA